MQVGIDMQHVSAAIVRTRHELTFPLCLRDDDAKVFEFRTTNDNAAVMNLVASAVSRERKVRAYVLAADPSGRAREERYLIGRGYLQMPVRL
jgi:hypothetical protein